MEHLRHLLAGYTDGSFALRLRSHDEQAPDVIQGDILCDGEVVGSVTRRVIMKPGSAPYVIHQDLMLLESHQGRGFGSRFARWSEERYRALGLDHIEIAAKKEGGYAWSKLGYEFDLDCKAYRAKAHELGAIEVDQRRAAAVRVLIDTPGRPISSSSLYGVQREENAQEALDRLAASSDAGRRAVEAFRERVASAEAIRDNDLEGAFLSPGDIAAFDQTPEAENVDVGRRVLLAAGWFGRKPLQ